MTIEAGHVPTTRDEIPTKKAVLAYYQISGSGTPAIFTMLSTGEHQVVVAKFVKAFGNPTWSPDGKKIAYAGGDWKSNEVQNPGLYVMDEDGENRIQLTDDDEVLSADPHYSPDGTKLVFTKLQQGTPSGRNIFTIRLADLALTQITNAPGLTHAGPQWSPDGQRILFTRSDAIGRNHIFVMAADGSSTVQLTDGVSDHFDPVWSPDGARIAFERRTKLGSVLRQDIVLMRSSGGSQVLLTNNDGDHHSCPAWSPSGEVISFSRPNSHGGLDLWAIRSDGTQAQIINDGFIASVFNAEWK